MERLKIKGWEKIYQGNTKKCCSDINRIVLNTKTISIIQLYLMIVRAKSPAQDNNYTNFTWGGTSTDCVSAITLLFRECLADGRNSVSSCEM